jgi:hypothetical protein
MRVKLHTPYCFSLFLADVSRNQLLFEFPCRKIHHQRHDRHQRSEIFQRHFVAVIVGNARSRDSYVAQSDVRNSDCART